MKITKIPCNGYTVNLEFDALDVATLRVQLADIYGRLEQAAKLQQWEDLPREERQKVDTTEFDEIVSNYDCAKLYWLLRNINEQLGETSPTNFDFFKSQKLDLPQKKNA